MSVTASLVFSFSSSRSLSSVMFSRKFCSRSAGDVARAVHGGHQFAQIADAGLGDFRVFVQALQFGEITGFVQKIFGPGLEQKDSASRRPSPIRGRGRSVSIDWARWRLPDCRKGATSVPTDGRGRGSCQLRAIRSTNSTNASMLSRVPFWKVVGHQRIFHGGEDGAFPLVAGAEQPFHRHVAQAARGHVGDAQQADVVVRIQEHFQVGEEILDFAPVKIALAADQMIAHAGRAQRGFQRARLLVGAEQNRAVPPRDAVRQPLEFDLRHHFARLVLVAGIGLQLDFRAGALAGPERLAAAPDVVFDDGVGGVENGGGGAVILLQLDDFDLGKMLLQVRADWRFPRRASRKCSGRRRPPRKGCGAPW